MKLIRRLTLALLGLGFGLSLAVVPGYAQPGHARWEGNRGLHRGWTIGRHRGWKKHRRFVGWNDFNGHRHRRLSRFERRRMAIFGPLFSGDRWSRDVGYYPYKSRRSYYRYRRYR